MRNSFKAYGLTRQVLEKIEAKYDSETEKTCMEWMEQVTGQQFYTKPGAEGVFETLKDGVILCNPGSIKKINENKLAFKQAAHIYGLTPTDLFQTVDLFEGKNMVQVLLTVMALGRKAQSKGYDGPTLGPKEATKNEREFSEEQLQEGKKIISLQMGTNKGANASGTNFGKPRSILD